ncbi:serine/threonine protein kinase [Pseudarthrobacter sp. MDT3-26]|uniref:serine/threonine protein kinase n=1 Tax=Pseudarthrobacter raffinosi TaxID=2953651 RepID=UPI00208FCB54|nr:MULTISPECIES: serine/threonine-protein kinase [unclassified Pseudarthrobacter]MCO4237908.1 serine/threonine protein kinase [Pseudarthrobacter sp. MDT3-28]MCO4263050.1 serine/threonine protein kinase [Pseudarthrobacter sp. MDT3-26]
MDDFTAPVVPGFLVGRVLGRGGSSTVWLVTEARSGREFALKCLGAGHGGATGPGEGRESGADAEEAIRREIRILSVLDHQHLIKAHDALRLREPAGSAVTAVGTIGLLLDYAPGGSLGELVGSRAKLTIGETVTVLTPIAQVLGYLHGQGFTHGDVSPGNVLFTGHGKPMLSDVGIARMVGDVSAVPDHGTPGFMDPAPVDAVRAGLQPERDVYSVAALGWYCLTGQPPRRTADRLPLSLLLPDVPVELAAALEAGLHEDRRLRPTAVELATAVYRSAPPLPVDLASSVHATVIPQLLTRRPVPEHPGGALWNGLRTWRRRISTSRWSGLVGVRQVLPFPAGEKAEMPVVRAPEPRAPEASAPEASAPAAGRVDAMVQAVDGEKPAPRGRHAVKPVPKGHEPNAGARRRTVASSKSVDPGPSRRRGRSGIAGHNRGTMLLAVGAGAILAGAIWAAGVFGPDGPWGAPAWPETVAESADAGGVDPVFAAAGVPADAAAQLDSADPLEAVRGLAAVRSLAFSSGRLELLDLVNAPGSAASAADAGLKAELQESGHVLAGFTSSVADLQVQPGGPSGQVVVSVTSATSPYEERDASGAIVAAGAPAAVQNLRLVLVSVDGRWRITDVLPGT